MHEIHPTRRRPVRSVSMSARGSPSHASVRARAETMRLIANESWPTRLVRGIRARVGELDPEARRADEDADPTRPGGVFDACARGTRRWREIFERWERVREVVVVRRGERAHGEHGGARCVNE